MKKKESLKIYKVLPKYVEALRDETNGGDKSVYMVNDDKSDRPFIGIISVCNNRNYFIPLTSYKHRFKYLTAKEPDFTPIFKKGKLIAGIEFNKMIPVPMNQIRPIDMIIRAHDGDRLKSKKILRRYEYDWCNKHADAIRDKAQKLYDMYLIHDTRYKNIQYCVNFPNLEKICDKYEQIHVPQYHKSQ